MKAGWFIVGLALVGFLPLGCSDSEDATSSGTVVLAAPVRCPTGTYRKGNKCLPNPTPPPTQTCWDGSVIPTTQQCPVQPPPPPATQTCPDGSVIPTTQTCPAPPPPPPVQCPDGTTVPAGQTCPVAPPPPADSWVSAPLKAGGYARLRNWPACCNGRIVRVSATHWVNLRTDIPTVPAGQRIWAVEFMENLPNTMLDDPMTQPGFFVGSDLEGVAPAGG